MGNENGNESTENTSIPYELLESKLFKNSVIQIIAEKLSSEDAEKDFDRRVNDIIREKTSFQNAVKSWKFWSLVAPIFALLTFLGIDRGFLESNYAQPAVHWIIDTDTRIKEHPIVAEIMQALEAAGLGKQTLVITEQFTLNEELQIVRNQRVWRPGCQQYEDFKEEEIVMLGPEFEYASCFDVYSKNSNFEIPVWVDVRDRAITKVGVSVYIRPLELVVECERDGQRGRFLQWGIPCFEYQDAESFSRDNLTVYLNDVPGRVRSPSRTRVWGDGNQRDNWHRYDIIFDSLNIDDLNDENLNRFVVGLNNSDNRKIIANVVFVVELNLSSTDDA